MKVFGRSYFGRYPIVNILVSNLVFWSFRHRERSLRRKNSSINRSDVQLKNGDQTRLAFKSFLDQGYTKINVGGGAKNFEGFVNLDFVAHKNVQREVVANVLDLAFIPDEVMSHIHSNHLVEHLTQEQLDQQLQQYKRILRPGGRISIRCPNVLGVCRGFFFGQVPEEDHQTFLDLGFPAEEDFYNPLDGWYHKDLYGLYHWIYADSGNIENEHLNQLTPTTLKKAVEHAGFQVLKMTAPETSNLVVVAEKQLHT